ncbi:MAG TPA: FAD-dependent oxidoreductase, partial [Bdellovibrionales bacterium]|nr:FAD-dependent oxidoreductase [Bdellovibrionales bacterium]
LKAVLFAYCVLHGVNPHEVSFGLHAILVDSLIRGAYGFANGGDALAERYVERIKANGGEVHLRKRVQKIETRNKAVQAVITEDGQRFEAQWVISGIHPKATFSIVDTPNVFTPAFRSRLERIKETPGIFGVYAKCRESSGFDPRKNYYFFGSLEANEMMRPTSPEARPSTVFISPAQRNEPQPKALNIHAISPLEWFAPWSNTSFGKRPAAYNELKSKYAGQVLEFVDEFAPGFKDRLEAFATSTPVTNLHFNGSLEGSPYGIYHSIENTGARALGPATHVTNLLITGQSSLFPGLLGAAVSALRTSGYIIGIKPVLKELREQGAMA